MGIEGLWTIVSPAVEKRSLMELCLNDGLEANKKGDHLYRVGIDASIYMVQAGQHIAHNHWQAGANPELRQIFQRLSYLLKYPIAPVFVFDGPGRPSQKRGKVVRKKPHWLSTPFQELIKTFGFEHHQAPGEAEAELAAMNKLGIIDAVITNDGDALIHGAQVVIKIPNIKKDGDQVEVVTSVNVERLSSLTSGGLLLFALLRGNDYSKGLEGCGTQIAYGLAKTGLGGELQHIMESSTSSSTAILAPKLNAWLDDLRKHLCFDTAGTLGRRYSKLADEIADGSFPNLAAAELFTKPLISSSFDDYFVRQPSISAIAAFCKQHFSWAKGSNLPSHLEEKIFNACVFRMLLKPVSESAALAAYFGWGSLREDELDRGLVLRIVELLQSSPIPHFCIQVSTLSFKTAAARGARIKESASSKPDRHCTKKILIPVCVLRLSLPHMAQPFLPSPQEVIYIDSDSERVTS